jgi:anti-sigma regulatory factor (Ser/Thr protein kinase)
LRSRKGGGGTPTAATTLPLSPASVRLARELVRRVTGGPEDLRAALVVTELVSNAIAHGDSPPTLTVGWDGRTVHLGVFDRGGGRPVVQYAEPTDTGGRGVALVDSVADRWGVTEGDGGKTVWADVELDKPLGS